MRRNTRSTLRVSFLPVFLFLFSAVALAVPPEIPWGGRNNCSDYPDYLRAWHDEKYEQMLEITGLEDYRNFLPRFTNGRSSEELGEIAYTETEQELLEFISNLPTTNLRWRIVGEFPSYGKADGPAAVSDGSFKLPLLVFSKPAVFDPADVKALGKPVIWLEGLIHGGETTGGSAMLVLAKRLADGDLTYVLDKLTVVMVPRYNVDGSWRNQRGTNSNRYRINIDQNRDNTGYESPITRLMHRLAAQYEPFFFGDAHEQGYTVGNGYIENPPGRFTNTRTVVDFSGFQIATLIAPIYNHPESLKQYVEIFETAYHQKINDWGWDWAWYTQTSAIPPGAPTDVIIGRTQYVPSDVRVTSGDEYEIVTAEEGGRKLVPISSFDGAIDTGITDPSAGLRGACSILTESITPAINLNTACRIGGHVAVYQSVLETAYERADEFFEVVLDARQGMIDSGKFVDEDNIIGITVRYPETPVDSTRKTLVPRKNDAGEWYLEETEWTNDMYLSRHATPFVSVVKPGAYILNVNDETIARLAHTGVEIERLEKDTEVEVEAYTVEDAAARVDNVSRVPSGMTGWKDAKVITEVSSETKKITFPKGTYVMYMDQLYATLAAYALEPLSQRNYGNYYLCMKTDFQEKWGISPEEQGFFKAEVGEEFPVYRYMSAEKLDTYSIGVLTAPLGATNAHCEWVLPYTQEEKMEIEEAIGMDALCISNALMWNSANSGFNAFLPSFAGSVDLREAKWFAYDWSEEKFDELMKYEEITAKDSSSCYIPAKYLNEDNYVLLVAGKEKPDEGSGGGCNTGFSPSGILLIVPLMYMFFKKH